MEEEKERIIEKIKEIWKDDKDNNEKVTSKSEKSEFKVEKEKSERSEKSEGKEKSEKRYKIIYERDVCIGAAACVMASQKFWQLDDEGKAVLQGSKETSSQIFEREIGEDELAENLEAAKSCPVIAIHIIDKKTGEKII